MRKRATVRQTAAVFGMSKSTVHKDVSYRLKQISPQLWSQTKKILDGNKAERHIRGGMATKEKYKKIKINADAVIVRVVFGIFHMIPSNFTHYKFLSFHTNIIK